jgi:hypothetical protein
MEEPTGKNNGNPITKDSIAQNKFLTFEPKKQHDNQHEFRKRDNRKDIQPRMVFSLSNKNYKHKAQKTSELPSIMESSQLDKTHFQAVSALFNNQCSTLSTTLKCPSIASKRDSPFTLVNKKINKLPFTRKKCVNSRQHFNGNFQATQYFSERRSLDTSHQNEMNASNIERSSSSSSNIKPVKSDVQSIAKDILLKSRHYRNKSEYAPHILKQGSGHLISGMGQTNQEVYNKLRKSLHKLSP